MQNDNHKIYLTDYKQHLLNLSKSINTINSYLSDLNQYFSLYQTINRSNIQLYKKEISHLAATTFNRKLSSVKQFNEYLVSKGLVDEIFMYRQDYIQIQDQGNPTNISEKTVLDFLQIVSTKKSIFKSRNIAIIYLMANSGIRREECCNMKLSNINLNKGEMTFRGKRNKERTVALTKKAIEVINNYLVDRINHKYADSEYLFLSERSKKLTKESINGIFDFYCTDTIKVKPHSLRHSYCTTMLEKGILSIIEIQNQVGHSNLVITQKYLHPRLDSIKKKISEYSIG